MKYIVTGGAGFIGSAFCRFLIANSDHTIINIDALTYAGSLSSLRSIENDARYKFIHADIRDAELLRSVFESVRPDAVIHLAAETHVDRSITGAHDFLSTNIIGTYNLLEISRAFLQNQSDSVKEAFRFLHVSTDEVYGSLGADGLFDDRTAYDPSSPYSASKAASDHLCMAWHRTYGLPVIISNCSNNYGPYQFPEKLIPLMILNALERKSLPVYGNGCNIRDWLHVDDHARALALLLQRGKPGHKYNVGGRNERSNLEVVKSICRLVDKLNSAPESAERLITFVKDRPGHDQRYAIDATKIERALGWRAQETFETGLEKTVRWYIDNEWWWRPLRETQYAGERLGLLDEHRPQEVSI